MTLKFLRIENTNTPYVTDISMIYLLLYSKMRTDSIFLSNTYNQINYPFCRIPTIKLITPVPGALRQMLKITIGPRVAVQQLRKIRC